MTKKNNAKVFLAILLSCLMIVPAVMADSFDLTNLKVLEDSDNVRVKTTVGGANFLSFLTLTAGDNTVEPGGQMTFSATETTWNVLCGLDLALDGVSGARQAIEVYYEDPKGSQGTLVMQDFSPATFVNDNVVMKSDWTWDVPVDARLGRYEAVSYIMCNSILSTHYNKLISTMSDDDDTVEFFVVEGGGDGGGSPVVDPEPSCVGCTPPPPIVDPVDPVPGPEPAVDSPEVVSEFVDYVNTGNGAKTVTRLKNVGGDMIESNILEMQVRPKGAGALSFVSDEQVACDTSYPENVHKEYKLNAGEQVDITLESDVEPGIYDIYMLTRKNCQVDFEGSVDENRVKPFHTTYQIRGVQVGKTIPPEGESPTTRFFNEAGVGDDNSGGGQILMIGGVLLIIVGGVFAFLSKKRRRR